ncbi:MAG: hypothetical protein AAGC45_11350 [Bacteroidota bacterium]
MKYQKYLVLAFVAALFLPLLSAKSAEVTNNDLNLNSVNYIEQEEHSELGFDTSRYLPENFDPFDDSFSLKSLNYIEDDVIDLGFDVQDYLPKNFDAYQK